MIEAPDSLAGKALKNIGQSLAAKSVFYILTRETLRRAQGRPFQPSGELRIMQ